MTQNYGSQPDHSGLQVIEHQHAPEPVDTQLPPEVVQEQHKYYLHQNPSVLPISYKLVESTLPIPTTHPKALQWWRRKRWIFLLVAGIVLAIVAIVVGAVVGTRSSSSSSPSSTTNPTSDTNNSPSNPTATYPPSACRNTICPQILSAAILNQKDLFLFARGNDNLIWYTSAPLNTNTQLTYSPWTPIPGEGPFLTQPSALVWDNNSKLSVLAASDTDRVVQIKTFSSPTTSSQWESIGLLSQSSLSTCVLNSTRPDFWSTADMTVNHNFLEPENSFSPNAKDGDWPGSATFNDKLMGSARPGIVCRQDGDYYHDLVVYGIDGGVRHSIYRKDRWLNPSNLGGKFKGDPTVAQVGNGRFDFWGIGDEENQGMWYFSWSKEGGYTPLERLGGEWESVPGVIVTGSGGKERIDVVALGRNDRLWHRVLKGNKWVEQWEDLGVFGNSAPLVVDLGGGRIGIYVVGVDGEVNQAVWSVSEETSWKGLIWTGMPGKRMTTAFYRS
ncbi:hypothetical protein QBC38DRAFT_97171 [Podospora fimiseda]|uniref:PLL-like beta propeller domain-containing protein n=1 Tax=Podospora fimiseda TaxID=252190 RepID=A0AAN7BUG5_9PEZI|nr:hypothetical protein QBC38DRAFT_97171 [Podospora fimiseda]